MQPGSLGRISPTTFAGPSPDAQPWGPCIGCRGITEAPMPLYEHVFIARQDAATDAGRAIGRPNERHHRSGRRQSHQARIMGTALAHLQNQQEPQGPLRALQHRQPVAGGRRDGTSVETQRRRHPPAHDQRRRTGRRPLGRHAGEAGERTSRCQMGPRRRRRI